MNPRTLDVVGREEELAAMDAVLEAVCGTAEAGLSLTAIGDLLEPVLDRVLPELPAGYTAISGGYDGLRLRIDRSLSTVNRWRMTGSAEVLGGNIQPFVLCLRFDTQVFSG